MKILNMFGPVYGYEDCVSASGVAKFLSELGQDENFEVYINSPGGSVFEGVSIYNLLAPHSKKFVVKIIGEASSIASVIACASDKVMIADSAVMLIHKPWTSAWAINEDGLEKLQKNLSVVKNSILTIYKKKTGKTEDELDNLMSEDLYRSAEDCVALGLADETYSPSDEDTTLITRSNNMKNAIISKLMNLGFMNLKNNIGHNMSNELEIKLQARVENLESLLNEKKQEGLLLSDSLKQKEEMIQNLQKSLTDAQSKFENVVKDLASATEKMWENEERLYCQKLIEEGKMTRAEYVGKADVSKGEIEDKVIKLVALRRVSEELYKMEKQELENRTTVNTLRNDFNIPADEVGSDLVSFVTKKYNKEN